MFGRVGGSGGRGSHIVFKELIPKAEITEKIASYSYHISYTLFFLPRTRVRPKCNQWNRNVSRHWYIPRRSVLSHSVHSQRPFLNVQRNMKSSMLMEPCSDTISMTQNHIEKSESCPKNVWIMVYKGIFILGCKPILQFSASKPTLVKNDHFSSLKWQLSGRRINVRKNWFFCFAASL